MSTLKEVLKDVPVEWKALGEMTNFQNGKGHEKVISDNGKYIVVNSKFVSTEGKVIKFSEEQLSPVFKDDILIVMSDLPNGRALAKTFLVDKNDLYTLNQRIGRISIKNKDHIVPSFLNYILNRSAQLLKYNNGVDQTNLKKADIENVLIPIPSPNDPEKSLTIQQEIVRILDELTEQKNALTEALSTEIENRKKQYDFYREQLFQFEGKEVEETKLGVFCKFTYGYAAKAEENGNARFVRITDINSNGELIASDAKFVTINDDNKKYLLEVDDILVARTGATFGKTMIFRETYSAIYAGFLIKISFDKNKMLPKYYWHYTQGISYWYQANKLVSGGGQPQFNTGAIKEIEVPLPFPNNPQKSLNEQAGIVSLLDKFDEATKAIVAELEKEIELRNKEYEYYRNLLLTFK
ncbi:restriction endonuclease subunit S [Empedobacter falsenii]